MSGHKPKHGKSNPPPNRNIPRGEEKSAKRHVYVEPGVQIDFVQDLKEKYESTQTDSKTHNKKQLFWTKVAAALLFLTAAFAGWQGLLTRRIANLTQRTYDTSERPYVGVYNIGHDLHYAPKAKKDKPSNENADAFEFEAEIKNFGPVPATNFTASWKVFLSDVQVPGSRILATASTLYPTELMSLRGAIKEGNDLKKLLHGITTLDIEVTVDYYGPQGHTTECSKHEYFAGGDGFFDIRVRVMGCEYKVPSRFLPYFATIQNVCLYSPPTSMV